MSSYPLKIKIQKLNIMSEIWEDYYEPHAKVEKVGGKEYTKARTVISQSTYNFKIRYCNIVEDIIYNTEGYRVIYKKHIFDIKNVDRYEENSKEIILTGEFNGKNTD